MGNAATVQALPDNLIGRGLDPEGCRLFIVDGARALGKVPRRTFCALKIEMVHRTRRKARAALFEYIEIFYNRKRRHSSVGYRTPAQARIDMTIKIAA